MEYDEDLFWLLNRIVYLEERIASFRTNRGSAGGWDTTRKSIFQGSYDVISHESEWEINRMIMNSRIQTLRDIGFIINESGEADWEDRENWSLTEKGKEYYQRHMSEGFK